MSHQALNNITHKSLKVSSHLSEQLGDNQGLAHVFPVEFAQLQSDFPLFIKQSASGESLEFVALMGFEKNENLFFQVQSWVADSMPLSLEKGPFLIGFEMQMQDGIPTQVPVVHIDTTHPKVSESEGEPLFLEHGGQSTYLERINSVLLAMHEGQSQANRLLSLLQKHDLIEPLSLDITFNNGEKLNLSGLMTINEEKLMSVSSDVIAEFHESHLLSSVYMVLASLPNIKKLISLKNKKLAG